jgi:hypothetical protein
MFWTTFYHLRKEWEVDRFMLVTKVEVDHINSTGINISSGKNSRSFKRTPLTIQWDLSWKSPDAFLLK